MSDDHLSNEIAVSVEVLPNGLKAGAKSRTLSSLDRLLGGAVDLLNPHIEGISLRKRAKNDADVDLIRALGAKRVAMVNSDPALAAHILEQHLGKIGRQQDNKAAVVAAALQDLRDRPPTEAEDEAGPAEIDSDLLNRLERYAEDASSDQLREKWGRVLAAEVRAPGTFSAKVMRTVDELDASTAALFERVCEARVGNCIPKAILPQVNYMEQTRLVSAGLIVEPGMGQARLGYTTNDASGAQLTMIPFGIATIGIVGGQGFKFPKAKEPPVQDHDGRPSAPIWLLTDVGHAISSILPSHETPAFERLFDKVVDYLKPIEVREYRQQLGSDQLLPVRMVSGSPDSPTPMG